MRYLDFSSIVVAIITLILFIAALITKGLTHDLLLETGVFMVSVKLIMMVHKNAIVEERIESKLDSIFQLLKNLNDK